MTLNKSSATPEWVIQVVWWVSGVFATGALWYFLSVKSYLGAGVAALGAIACVMLAVHLHRKTDGLRQEVKAHSENSAVDQFVRRYTDQPNHMRFLRALPKLKSVMYEMAQEGWDTGVTLDMQEASFDVIDFLEFAWLRVAQFYPEKHFGDIDAAKYIRKHISDRFNYHWLKYEPHGPGTGGTIVGILTAKDVISDIEQMIADTVLALFAYNEEFDYDAWRVAWVGGNASSS